MCPCACLKETSTFLKIHSPSCKRTKEIVISYLPAPTTNSFPSLELCYFDTQTRNIQWHLASVAIVNKSHCESISVKVKTQMAGLLRVAETEKCTCEDHWRCFLRKNLCTAKSVFRLEANPKAAQSPSCCKKVLSLGKYRSCARLFATFQGLQWPQSALGICKILSGAKRWSGSLIKGKPPPPPNLTSTNAMKNWHQSSMVISPFASATTFF